MGGAKAAVSLGRNATQNQRGHPQRAAAVPLEALESQRRRGFDSGEGAACLCPHLLSPRGGMGGTLGLLTATPQPPQENRVRDEVATELSSIAPFHPGSSPRRTHFADEETEPQ